jgi:hypothetical protein
MYGIEMEMMSFLRLRKKNSFQSSAIQPFLGGNSHFDNEKLPTHLEYTNYNNKYRITCAKRLRKVKVWNYLATHH